MASGTVAILGIPVDNLSPDDAVNRIFAMIDDYADDGIPRQVATVNVDFVVNTLTWRLGRVRHPELIDILRRADLVTADGMPIVWMSKLTGNPLKGRVTGADLVPLLAQEAANRGKSIYFLGGRGDVGQRAAQILKERCPNLRIAGVDSPFVHTDGEAMERAEEEDRSIVRRVNRSGADILLIAFGNPKQEIWFERNRKNLKVPVSIGIGGTYEFIVGSVKRAPDWIQKTGFEWVYRITQDPKRLWKRYFVGLFKFGLIVLPSISYYRYKRFVHERLKKKDMVEPTGPSYTSVGDHDLIRIMKLPKRLDAKFLDESEKKINTNQKQSPHTLLDLTQTTFIDSTGLGYLIKLWRNAGKNKKSVYMFGVNPSVRQFLKLNRLWDIFQEGICENIDEALTLLEKKTALPGFYFIMEPDPGAMVIRLFGRLDALQMSHLDLDAMLKDIGDSHCILDLKNLSFVDSTGLTLFIRLQRYFLKKQRHFFMCRPSATVTQMFKITKLDHLFKKFLDMDSAKKELEAIE